MKLTKIITGIITLASLSLFAQKTSDTNGEDWKIPKSPKWEELKKEPIILCSCAWWSRLCERIVCGKWKR